MRTSDLHMDRAAGREPRPLAVSDAPTTVGVATDLALDPTERAGVGTPARSRRRRWWLVSSLAVIAVLAALRLAAPTIVALWIGARLSALLDTSASIEDVELRLWAGELTVRGIHAVPGGTDSASDLQVDALTMSWRWGEMLSGDGVVEVSMSGVAVMLDLSRPLPSMNDVTSGGLSLRSLVVTDGSLAAVMGPQVPPIFTMKDVQAGLVVNSAGLRPREISTRVWATGATDNGGSVVLDGWIAPVRSGAGLSLKFALDRIDLRRLNPVFERVLEMEVERGWLSVTGKVRLDQGRLHGSVQPRFDELRLGGGERRGPHAMAEALLTALLSGADLPIDLDQTVALSAGSLVDEMARIDAKSLLTRTILDGFIRRLDTLDDCDAAVAGIEVDFPAGRLSFFDVKLTKQGGPVGRPFVTIERLDIVVEQSAVDSRIATYQSITLHSPSLAFVEGTTAARTQLTFDPDWREKVSVLPYPTDRLEIFDGRVEYNDETTEPPTSLFVSDLELRADNLGRALAGKAPRAATLEGRARAMDLSALTLHAEFSPGARPLDAAARVHLDPLPLRELNGLLRGRFGVDVSSGTVGLEADLDVRDGRLLGKLTPRLRRIRVIGFRELEIEHPLRELLLERRLRRLDGTALRLDHSVHRSLLRELPPALLSAVRHAE